MTAGTAYCSRLAAFILWMLCGAMNAFAASPRDSIVQDSLVGDKFYYLELKGTIRHLTGENKDEAIALDSAVIKVYNERNMLVAQFLTSKKGRCNFKLPLNRRFIVEVSKRGYVSKKLEVNTKVPPEKKFAYVFPFSLDIFEDVPGLDVSILNKPIARVSYLFTISQFDYDNVYTSKINTDLKKMYKEYYQLQKIAADSAVTTTGKDGKPGTATTKKPGTEKKTVEKKAPAPQKKAPPVVPPDNTVPADTTRKK